VVARSADASGLGKGVEFVRVQHCEHFELAYRWGVEHLDEVANRYVLLA
jgi:hypothetical protein